MSVSIIIAYARIKLESFLARMVFIVLGWIDNLVEALNPKKAEVKSREGASPDSIEVLYAEKDSVSYTTTMRLHFKSLYDDFGFLPAEELKYRIDSDNFYVVMKRDNCIKDLSVNNETWKTGNDVITPPAFGDISGIFV